MTEPNAPRVLVAGIGNVFLGDDGFGVEVLRCLREVDLPAAVDIADYGIRGMHLAFDLLDGRHPVLVMVDALALDDAPGTLAVIEVDLADPGWTLRPADALAAPAADGHGMDPESVLRLLRSLGGRLDRVLVLGCQPARLDEGMEMSVPVRAAVAEAVRMVTRIAAEEAARLGDMANRAGSPDQVVLESITVHTGGSA